MSERGPFDRGRLYARDGGQRDRSAQVVLIALGVLGLVLFLVVLSPFSLFGDGDGEDSPLATGASNGRVPSVPEGYTVLSILVDDLRKPADTDGPYLLTVPLLEPATDGRNLGLYTHRNGRWERLSSATLVSNGTAATGEVAQMPENLAVLRVSSGAVGISGWLPAGAQPDPGALAALGTINPVDYAPLPDGGVAGTATDLGASNARVVPTIRAALPEHDEAVNAILSSPPLREEHVRALVQLSLSGGYAGIDIDYPRVSAALRADYTAFISALASQLHQANRTLTVTLPMPVRTGVTWETGAYDWPHIAERADQIKLRSERDPSLFHARMTEVLDYLRGTVDLRKVSLVVGRESYERASDGLRAISLYEGLALASDIEVRTASQIVPGSSVVVVGRNIYQDDGASGLRWDEQARAVSFEYPGRGGTRTVWLENSLSLSFKLDLARRYGLAGVTISDVSDNPGFVDYWEPLRRFGEAGEVTPVQANAVMLRPTWEAQAGASQGEPKGNLIWTAPSQPGTYEVALIVSDGVIRVSQTIALEVRAPAP